MLWKYLCLFIVIVMVMANDLTEQELDIFSKTPDELWQSYKEKYNKIYPSEDEETYRKGVVLEKYRKLKEQLELRNKSLIIYTINISKYSDLSNKEFVEKMFGPENDQKAMYFRLNEFLSNSVSSSSMSLNSVLFVIIVLILYS